MITSYTIRREGRSWIGDAVAKAVNDLERETGGPVEVVAVVPKLLSLFAGDARYEVIEVDLLVRKP